MLPITADRQRPKGSKESGATGYTAAPVGLGEIHPPGRGGCCGLPQVYLGAASTDMEIAPFTVFNSHLPAPFPNV